MLNRRILRVKAMQALYSYYLTEESLKQVVQEQLESNFYPDPAKDDFSEADQFKKRRKTAARLYEECLGQRSVSTSENIDEDIVEEVQSAINKYYRELDEEKRHIRSDMLKDVDSISRLYLKILLLPVEFAHIEKLEKEKKEKAYIPKASFWKYHFINNPVCDELTKFEPFSRALLHYKISWSNEPDVVRSWYKEVLRKDETLIEYQQKENPTIEEHREAIVYLLKKLVMKSDTISDYLSSIDMHWAENKTILTSLVVKTIQSYNPEQDEPFELKEVSKNEEEDLDFFKKLFDKTLKENSSLDEIIAKRTRNWDISRVAILDRIILKMALTEMVNFHSIPIKVTINEFIEISKLYSTPKSKQFINGILDVLANELTSEGVIKKSGRGLIDNR